METPPYIYIYAHKTLNPFSLLSISFLSFFSTYLLTMSNQTIRRNKTNSMEPIPWDLVCHILKRLPVKGLLRFKSLSKGWFSLIDDPCFIKLHLKESLETYWRITSTSFFMNTRAINQVNSSPLFLILH